EVVKMRHTSASGAFTNPSTACCGSECAIGEGSAEGADRSAAIARQTASRAQHTTNQRDDFKIPLPRFPAFFLGKAGQAHMRSSPHGNALRSNNCLKSEANRLGRLQAWLYGCASLFAGSIAVVYNAAFRGFPRRVPLRRGATKEHPILPTLRAHNSCRPLADTAMLMTVFLFSRLGTLSVRRRAWGLRPAAGRLI